MGEFILHTFVDLNSIRSSGPQFVVPKCLLDMCAEKLISNVWLVSRTRILCLPKRIFSILLSKAIESCRILSLVELIKSSPCEEIKLPTPNAFKDMSASGVRRHVKNEIKKFYDISLSILSTFLQKVVGQRSCNSQLKTLDFGAVPLDKEIIKLVKDFIENSPEISSNDFKCANFKSKKIKKSHEVHDTADLEYSQKKYILKFVIAIKENISDFDGFVNLYEKANSIGIQIIITGIVYYNIWCPIVLFKEMSKVIKLQDFKQFTASFSQFYDLADVFGELKKFKYLEYLNVASMKYPFEENSTIGKKISTLLTELTYLKRLILQNIELTGCLSYICELCKRKSDPNIVDKCCLSHCGSLEYLDISKCSLSCEDLIFLKELAVNNSLKYLDISYNALEVTSTLQALLHLRSSLVVLKMAYCFNLPVEYNSESFPLSSFSELRILDIRGMMIERSKQMLYSQLEKMEFTSVEIDHKPPYHIISYDQFGTLQSKQLWL